MMCGTCEPREHTRTHEVPALQLEHDALLAEQQWLICILRVRASCAQEQEQEGLPEPRPHAALLGTLHPGATSTPALLLSSLRTALRPDHAAMELPGLQAPPDARWHAVQASCISRQLAARSADLGKMAHDARDEERLIDKLRRREVGYRHTPKQHRGHSLYADESLVRRLKPERELHGHAATLHSVSWCARGARRSAGTGAA